MQPPQQQLHLQQQGVMSPRASALDEYHFFNDPVIAKWRRRRRVEQTRGLGTSGQFITDGGATFLLGPDGQLLQPQQLHQQQQQQQQQPYEMQYRPTSILKNSPTKSVTFSEPPDDAGIQRSGLLRANFDRRPTRDAISQNEVEQAQRIYFINHQHQQQQQSSLEHAPLPLPAAEGWQATPKIVVEDENQSVFYKEFGDPVSFTDPAAPAAAAAAAAAARRRKRVSARDRSRFEEIGDDSEDEALYNARRETRVGRANNTTKSSACLIL